MKRYEISWFNEFECLCGSCAQTCCKGWLIPLEEEDITRLKKERGMLGLKLFCATAGWTRDKFNADSGTCPFLGEDGLCRMQKERGHDFLPETCRDYPRFYRNYGRFEEVYLDLSCIGAVDLFLEHPGPVTFNVTEAEAVTDPCSTNDDEDFLDFLLEERAKMTGEVEDADSPEKLGQAAGALFSYSCTLQGVCADNGRYEQCRFSAGLHNSKSLFPLPVRTLRRLMNSSLRHFKLRKSNPELYEMLSAADRTLSKYGKPTQGWQDDVYDALSHNTFLMKTMSAYLSYYLHQYFLRAYETYSFRRQIALGLCHLNMVLLLIMSCTDAASAGMREISPVIAAYNRRAYFSDSILDEMYRIFEDACAAP